MPVLRVPIETEDLARLPYGGEIKLDSIPPGQYVLEITATDQITKTSASQNAKVTIE